MKNLFATIIFVLCTLPALAWPTCNGTWNQVPKGTSSANGVIYITGDNLTFQCQKTPTPPTKPTSSLTNNSSSTSSASSASNSSASSNQKQSQGQSQGQVANGGSATATSSAADNGNNSNNSTSITNVAAPKIPVATAYAPATYPTVTCFKGFGAGVQTAPAGVSFGGGKIDENCAILEAAARAQNKVTYCKVYISNKYVKKAGVTFEDCMAEPAPNVMIVRETVPTLVDPLPPPIIDTVPVTVIPATEFGQCVFPNGARLTNECKAILDTAVLYSKKASGGFVVLEADALTGVYKAQAAQKYLERNGVNGDSILVKMRGNVHSTNVGISYSEQ